MRPWRWGTLIALLATAAAAQDLGDGHLGDLVVDNPGVIPNRPLKLSQNVKAGDTLLPVPTMAAFFPSDLLMLIRVRGGTSDGSETMQASGAGDTFFTRISHVDIQGFDINPPIDRDWPAADTEIIYVPEYRNLTVTANGSLYAQTFDGTIGGVVALLVTNELRVDGTLNADRIGFRGGASGVNGVNSGAGCGNPNEPAPGGAQKGEGLLAGPWDGSLTGFGRNGNGGGGAVCQASGGGGGANAGKGGQGGASTDGLRPVGGQGGAAVVTSFLPLFGGGGGGGTYDGTGSSGGAGGGIVIIRAGHISGSGLISARGADALTGPAESPTSDGSPGGGGAGGSIDILSVQPPTCHVSVKGGNGGLPAGGGGGGGRVRFSAPNSDGCTADLTAGLGASSTDKQAQPTSEQAAGYIGTLDVETLNPMGMMLPNRYEFGTLGCSSTGGSATLGALALVLVARRRYRATPRNSSVHPHPAA